MRGATTSAMVATVAIVNTMTRKINGVLLLCDASTGLHVVYVGIPQQGGASDPLGKTDAGKHSRPIH